MPKIVLDKETARRIVQDNEEGWKLLAHEIIDQSRWTTAHMAIVQRESDGKTFRTYYQVGSTEYQDESPFEYTDVEFIEVAPKETVVTVYEPVA